MNATLRRLVAGSLLASALAAPAAFAEDPEGVTVRVEGAWRTQVDKKPVALPADPVVKDGNPEHACSGTSAAGALEAATSGAWGGGWADGLGYFVSTIGGEFHSGSPDYWALWVNGKPSTTGLCDTTLAPGADVLLFVDRCEFDAATQACANDPVLPLAISAPETARAGRTVTVTVTRLGADGKATAVRGATVKAASGPKARTDARGRARLRLRDRGLDSLRAYKSGLVRSERLPVRVR